MAKKDELVKIAKDSDKQSSTDVGAEQNDLEMRGKQAGDEIAAICRKYNVAIGSELVFAPTGITSKPIIIDAKGLN